MSNLEKRLRDTIAQQHKSAKTADVYWGWVKRFLLFAKMKRGCWVDPKNMGKHQVEIFLRHLAVVENVSANTQNQAFSALCFLYKHVIRRPLEDVSALRAKRPDRVREAIDEEELVELFQQLSGIPLLCARMMYASSFRIGELAKIRIKDISFQRKQIIIHGGKGEKDRIVGFPSVLHEAVKLQIESTRVLWKHDVADGLNGVSLPHAFGRKSPSAHKTFAWYYLFCADHYSRDPVSGRLYRHSRDMGNVARQIKQAAEKCGFAKRVTSHCLRHSFATHSVENGVPIHVLQKLMGHTSIETTETYLHVRKDGVTAAQSPLEKLESQAVAIRKAT